MDETAPEVTALLNTIESLEEVNVHEDARGIKIELSELMPPATATTQEISHSPLENLPSSSDIRSILGPLVASNAQARVDSGTLGKEALSAEPQGGIQGLLTDEICDTFAEQMRSVEEGKDFSPSNEPSNMNDKKIPKAPRAMLMNSRGRASGDILRKRDRNKSSSSNSPAPNLRIPAPSSTTLASSQEAAPPVPLSTPSSEGISIPLDSNFFIHSQFMEQEEGEIVGTSSPTSRTSPHVRKTSPLKIYPTSAREYSPSPELVHRLPKSRTYRSRSPSEGFSYRNSHSSRSRSFQRSQSPTHTRRPSFPDDLGGPPSPSPERVRHLDRRRSSSRAPRLSELTSPISPRSDTHQRRGSDYETRRGKSKSYSRKDDGHPDKDAESGEKNYMHSVNGGVTLLNHCPSDRERRRSSTQGREFDAQTMRRKIPTRSISPTNGKSTGQHFTSGDQNNVCDMKLTASPLSMTTLLLGTTECESSLYDQARVIKPCYEVPGLWMIKPGGSGVEIVTCEFEIDKATAGKWNIPGPSRHGKQKKARDAISLSLMCMPLSDNALRGKLDAISAAQREFINGMAQIEGIWPPAGHLVIEVNPDHDRGRSWLPRHLRREHASIDITDHVHEGMNIIRLIQLASLADCMFVILAEEKPPDAGANDLEPALDMVEMEVDGPQTTEQLLASFRTSTQIIYS